MTTGKHTIATVFCCQCDTEVGWRYVCDLLPSKSQLPETYTNQSLQRLFQIKAFEDSQKYKEGACILEKALLTTVK